MKLRNKKTGEIGKVYLTDNGIEVAIREAMWSKGYNSLDELNAEWEDYEEPKGKWTIDPMNEGYIDDGRYTTPDELERYEELGLKFNTKEEAEKAVEKLKAWTRLKDKGFKFTGWSMISSDTIVIYANRKFESIQADGDLDLLFGGERLTGEGSER